MTPRKVALVLNPKHLCGSKSKETKRFVIFDPKKEGPFCQITPTPTPTPQKVRFKWGGGPRGVPTKTHWGMRLLEKIVILQGVKPTIQPLGVGYANRPKKAQNGGGGMVWYGMPYGIGSGWRAAPSRSPCLGPGSGGSWP